MHLPMSFTRTLISTVFVFLLVLGSNNSLAAEQPGNPDTVVLLHGLGRTAKSMSYMEERLAEAGYTVFNYDYESRKKEIGSLVEDLQIYIEKCCLQEDVKLHFVTHSLGGILVRALIADKRPSSLGRVVMLSPPNKGSETVDQLKNYSFFQKVFGPSSMQLGTGTDSLPNRLGPADFELGIITGDRTIDPISSWIIPGEDDGKVAVEKTKLEGMADFRVVNVSHAYIMKNPEVVDEVLYFLKNGRFRTSETPVPDR
jgi:pimeloyl-ACP methyl ester carboxylesterase